MKSLNEEVAAIKAASISKDSKKAALVKLGITPYEIEIILTSADNVTAAPRGRYTFGVEIECFVNKGAIRTAAQTTRLDYEYEGYNHRDGHAYFKFTTDASVRGMADPIECVSPVLKGTQGMAKLKKACKTLNKANAKVNHTCGLHVHIGADKLNEHQYVSVFVNYLYLESLIDGFMAPSRREDNAYYALSLKRHEYTLLNHATRREDVRRIIGTRYSKVNPESYARHRTIEFRQHQGSTDFEKISNWVSFCGKLVNWSKSHRLTAPVTSIDEIEFLSEAEKEFFKARTAYFANR